VCLHLCKYFLAAPVSFTSHGSSAWEGGGLTALFAHSPTRLPPTHLPPLPRDSLCLKTAIYEQDS